jgi:16S rRNA (cytidine1402-2'-O)-methyltransferase
LEDLTHGSDSPAARGLPGTLYVVGTPIGNLEDITFRAVRILGEVDAIACEDTRQTQRLLDHYGIRKPLVSYHEHNEQERAVELIDRLEAGACLAIVSDAGTPLVADPGYRLVSAAASRGIAVVPVPGPSAVLAALSAAGLATDAFRFCGFLPAKAGQRRKALDRFRNDPATLIFYEAPHRIVEALEDIEDVLGSRSIVLARELTKIHEEFLRGTAEELTANLRGRPSVKGEFTILIGKATAPDEPSLPVREAVGKLESEGVPRMEAMKRVARERGVSKRDIYQEITGAES